jgi:hypothetical protein
MSASVEKFLPNWELLEEVKEMEIRRVARELNKLPAVALVTASLAGSVGPI